MMKQRVVVIGSGLGGLSCGVLLAKHGYDVTVVEQGAQAGGCLQCFTRGGVRFETGMHYIGSAGRGETLDVLLRYLEVRGDIRLSALDAEGYEVVSLQGRRYRYAQGREGFVRQMAEYFPAEREHIERYYDLVEQVARASALHSLRHAESDAVVNTEYQLRSVNEVIGSTVSDTELANVLAGVLPLYAGEWDKTPFATHAFIMDFYNKGAYRIAGGSDGIAASLTATIRKYGGRVLTRTRATRILCGDSRVTGVEVNSEDVIAADWVIAAIHPKRMLELTDSKLIRPAFRQRIGSMQQTVGGFSVYLEFKERAVRYQNYNFYGYATDTPWGCEHYDEASWPKGYLYMHFADGGDGGRQEYAQTGVVISYMQMKDVERWAGSPVGRRGEAYEDFKRRKAERLLALVERDFPDLRESIKHYYTSTPLTYRDYTGTEDGGMYGVARDIRQGVACRVPQKTKVPGLLLSGQNINSHGILGVLVGSIVTCSELLTAERIYQELKKTMNYEL